LSSSLDPGNSILVIRSWSFDPRRPILVVRSSSSEQIIDEPHERPQEEQREYDGRDLERSLLSRKIVPAVRAFVRGGIDRQRAGRALSVVRSHPEFPLSCPPSSSRSRCSTSSVSDSTISSPTAPELPTGRIVGWILRDGGRAAPDGRRKDLDPPRMIQPIAATIAAASATMIARVRMPPSELSEFVDMSTYLRRK